MAQVSAGDWGGAGTEGRFGLTVGAGGSGSTGVLDLMPKVLINVSQAERLGGDFGSSAGLGASKPGIEGSLFISESSLSGLTGSGTVPLIAELDSDSFSSPHMLDRRRWLVVRWFSAARSAEASGACCDSCLGSGVGSAGENDSRRDFSVSGGSAGPGIPNCESRFFQLSDI